MTKNNFKKQNSGFFVYERQEYTPFRDGLTKKRPITFEYKPNIGFNSKGKEILSSVIKIDRTMVMLKTNTCLALFGKRTFTEFDMISGLRPVRVSGDEWLFGDVKNWKTNAKSLFVVYTLSEYIMAIEVFFNYYPVEGELYKFLYQHIISKDTVSQVKEISKLIEQKKHDNQ